MDVLNTLTEWVIKALVENSYHVSSVSTYTMHYAIAYSYTDTFDYNMFVFITEPISMLKQHLYNKNKMLLISIFWDKLC